LAIFISDRAEFERWKQNYKMKRIALGSKRVGKKLNNINTNIRWGVRYKPLVNIRPW
jgi:hypothetical protein